VENHHNGWKGLHVCTLPCFKFAGAQEKVCTCFETIESLIFGCIRLCSSKERDNSWIKGLNLIGLRLETLWNVVIDLTNLYNGFWNFLEGLYKFCCNCPRRTSYTVIGRCCCLRKIRSEYESRHWILIGITFRMLERGLQVYTKVFEISHVGCLSSLKSS